MDWKQLLAYITGSVDQELLLRNEYLVTENRILRSQIKGRVHLSDGARMTLAEIGKKLSKQALEEVASIVKPETILGWHRTLVAQKFDGSKQRRAPGRPVVNQEVEALVVHMAQENRSWGYDRIVGALVNLGYTISDQTVGNMLKRYGIPPAPERKKTISWAEFIRIHMDVLGATDFFTSTVWRRMKLVISFLLVFISVGRHTKHFTDMTASLTTWFAFWDADVERWIRSGLKHVMLRLLGYGHVARRPLLSACDIHDHHEGLPRSIGKVILLPIIHLRPIRDGPMRQRPWLGEMLTGEDREAA